MSESPHRKKEMIIGLYRLEMGVPTGNVITIASDRKQLSQTPRPGPIFQRPRPFDDILDRQNETDTALKILEKDTVLKIYGPDGSGKTSFLRHLAYHSALSTYPDGIVYLSAYQTSLDSLQQSLFDAFYRRPSTVKVTQDQIHQALKNKQALILLDDVSLLASEIAVLRQILVKASFVFTSHTRHLETKGQSIALLGLPPTAAQKLLAETYLRLKDSLSSSSSDQQVENLLSDGATHHEDTPIDLLQSENLSPKEQDLVTALCTTLDGQPLPLQQAAALACTPSYDLGPVLQLAKQSPTPEAFAANLIEPLSEDETHLLTILAAFNGSPVSIEHLSILSDLIDPSAVLDSLLQRYLLQASGNHYYLSGPLNQAIQKQNDLEPWARRALTHFMTWTEQHQDAFERLLEHEKAILQCLRWAVHHNRWNEMVRLGLAVEQALVLRGHWDTWKQVLEWKLQAAQVMKNQAAEAWVLHQLGTRALCLNLDKVAHDYLSRSFRLREALGDSQEISATKNTLNFLLQAARHQNAQTETRYVSYEARSLSNLSETPPPPPIQPSYTPPPPVEPSPAYTYEPSPPPYSAPQSRPSPQLRPIPHAHPHPHRHNRRLWQMWPLLLIALAALIPVSIILGILVLTFSSAQLTPTSAITGNVEPVLSISPSAVNFGPQPLKSDGVIQNISLINQGIAPLRLQSSMQDDTGFVILNDTCSELDLQPNAPCTITVAYVPAKTGPNTANLTLFLDDRPTPQLVPLSGIGIAPGLSFSPDRLNFSDQPVGLPSEERLVVVNNSGSANLFINAANIAGSHPKDFIRINDTCTAATIPPRNQCTLQISFVPNTEGERLGQVNLLTNISDNPQVIPLQGLGLPGQPEIQVEPASLSFPEQQISRSSPAQIVLLTNQGFGDLIINTVELNEAQGTNYLINANTCTGTPLKPQGTCRIALIFAPTHIGNLSANLIITHQTENGFLSIPLNGTAVGIPNVDLTPTSLVFPEQTLGETSPIQPLTVSNNGTGNLTLNAINLSGDHPSDFKIMTNTCLLVVLAPETNCLINLAFSPLTAGTRTAILNINSDAVNSPQRVSLSGQGENRPDLALSTSNLRFGQWFVNTSSTEKIVTLTNIGSGDLSIREIVPSGSHVDDFQVTNDTCSNAILAPKTPCLVGLTFTPSEENVRNATLLIYTNTPHSPYRVQANGVGQSSLLPTPTFLIPTPTAISSQILTDTQIQFNTTNIQFSPIEVGHILTKTIYITSTGKSAAIIHNTEIGGANPVDFEFERDTCDNITLDSQETCIIIVRFRPDEEGERAATVLITHNDGSEAITLKGTGTGE